jgi:hypothetical protein
MSQYRLPILIGLIFVVLTTGIVLFTLNVIVKPRGVVFDFYPHWVYGRAVWNGENPYTLELAQQVQIGMFGRVAREGEDQFIYPYPAYSGLMLAPVLIFPAQTAIAVWMALQLVALLCVPLVWLGILDWRPPPLALFLLTFGLTFAFRYPMNVYILGQFPGLMTLTLSLGVLLLVSGYDVLAGIIFVLATMPPTTGGTLAGLILGALFLRGRWRGLAAFVVTLALLTFITILRIGWWIPDLLNVLRGYSSYAPPAWSPGFIALPLRYAFVALVVMWLGWALFRFWRLNHQYTISQPSAISHQPSADSYTSFIDYTITAILACLLLLPQTGNYYLVLLSPVIVITVYRAKALRWRWLIWLSCVLAVLSPWLYLYLGDDEQGFQMLLVPLHVALTWGAALYLSQSPSTSAKVRLKNRFQ